MIPPKVYLQPQQNPMELEEALRMRGYGNMTFGVETWLHESASIEGESFDHVFTDWNDNSGFNCVHFISGSTAVSTGPPLGSATAGGLRVRLTSEKQASGKVASQASSWRLDWLSGALTLTKGTTAGTGPHIATPRTASLLAGERVTVDLYLIGGSTTQARVVTTLADGTMYDDTLVLATPFTTIDLSGTITLGNGIVGNVQRFGMNLTTATSSAGTAIVDMNPQGLSPYLASFTDVISTRAWALTNSFLVSRV